MEAFRCTAANGEEAGGDGPLSLSGCAPCVSGREESGTASRPRRFLKGLMLPYGPLASGGENFQHDALGRLSTKARSWDWLVIWLIWSRMA